MTANRRLSIAWLAALAIVLLAAGQGESSGAGQIYRPETEAEPAQLMLGSAQADTIEVYSEDFSDGPSGWVAKDFMAQDVYWHRASWSPFGSPPLVGVMWCGTDDPTLLWGSPPGYGNNWIQFLTKSFTLPSGAVSVDYSLQYDTEPGYDFLYLDISTDGGVHYSTLETWNGNTDGFVSLSTDLGEYAGQTVILRFRFQSDGAWSDEDGLYPSDGGAHLDWIQVTGGQLDDFESGDNGWVASTKPELPVQYRLEATPPCASTLPCPGFTGAWVGYDPATGVFPFERDWGWDIEFGIESPAITIPTDAVKYLLKFDLYENLPMDDLVFYAYSAVSCSPGWTDLWRNDLSVRYGVAGVRTRTLDITDKLVLGATQVKIRLRAIDMYNEWVGVHGSGDNHTSAPMFDNVRICAVYAGAADTDGDGVIDTADLCPSQDASGFDSNGDGCIDDGAGGRHTEYWDRADFPITYLINEDGAPEVTDGSDLTAVQDALSAWAAVPDIDASVAYGGTTAQADAQALDHVNLVTFNDPDYRFGVGVLAVGLSTSFTEPTEHNGHAYRPGEIADVDMILNPAKAYRTASDGPIDGTYIEAVATHEAGHLFGISHSAVQASTMYFILPPGMEAATLAAEDRLAMFKAYGTPAAIAGASRLTGGVFNGYDSQPIPGAAVFAISAASGDTLGCEYTLPDGSYIFIGLPDGAYYVAVHPLDGSPAIGYLEPAYINDLIANTATTVFVSEWWDAAESPTDDPAARDAIAVAAGSTAYADIVTNIDATPPVILSTIPAPNAANVSVGGSVMVSFSEPINDATLQGNFRLTESVTGNFVSGNATILNGDSVVAFVPSAGLSFSTGYRLRLATGLQDKFGNGLAAPVEITFTTEPEPDVALTSLVPSKGVAGIVVSVNGKGFDPVAANNTVTFSGVAAAISQASPTQLVVTVPDGAASGVVHVYNHTQGLTSNDLQFTVLAADEVPRGFDFGVASLSATPRALAVVPTGSHAFVATDTGLKAVAVDPALSGYMSAVTVPISGGLSDIDASPAGNRVYAVSYSTQKIYRIDSTPASIGVLGEKALGATPRGILIHPRGHRAFIPTYDGDIQVWDIDESSPTFDSQVGRIILPDANIRGKLVTDPPGDRLLVLTGTGKMMVFSLDSYALLGTVKVGPDPRDVAVDPMGQLAYVCDGTGLVSVVSLSDYTCLQSIRTGGSLRGISIAPTGNFAYAANREMNLLDAIDLREDSPTYYSVAATIAVPTNPVDIELSPDGDYAFTISEAEERLVVTTVGVGPSLATLSRYAGPPGARLVIAGSDFSATSSTSVAFGSLTASPERMSDKMLAVTVPAAAVSGKVAVVTTDISRPAQTSNAAYFEVLGPTLQEALRLAASLPSTPSPADGGAVVQASPGGDFVAIADRVGGMHLLATQAGSADYHKYIGTVTLGSNAIAIVFAPDEDRAFVVLPGALVKVIGVDRLSPEYLATIATIDFSGTAGAALGGAAVSPDGSQLLVSDPGTSRVHFVDISAGSPTRYTAVRSVNLAAGAVSGVVREMAFHPAGAYAYLAVEDSDPAAVLVLDTAPTSPTYGTVVSTRSLPGTVPQEVPISLGFTPGGQRCLVLTSQQVGTPNRSVVMLNTATPASPTVSTTLSLGGAAPFSAEHLVVSPRGDRAVANIRGVGLLNIRIGLSPDALALAQQAGVPADHATSVGIAYAPDASKFYCLSDASDKLALYDFSAAQTMAILSGNGQSGVVSQPLARPLRVQAGTAGGGAPGIPVTFEIKSGGGRFAANGQSTLVVQTDAYGAAEARWILGPVVGTGGQAVEARAIGLTGSPLTFTASGLPDPTTLPLTVAAVVPADGASDVSVATSVQVTFSRPVDPATVTSWSLYLRDADSNTVPATIGFADDNRKVSLSPRAALGADAAYWIEVDASIQDESGGGLLEAVSSAFTTEPPPPVVLNSIAPVSGPEGATVVLSGTGFNEAAALNRVLFSGLEARVTAGGKDFLNALVPQGAVSGPVRVVNTDASDTSNALVFTVLPPRPERTDRVVASVGTGTGTHGVAITPDGGLAYAVSPYANRVVVISLRSFVPVAAIPVGDNPVSITIDPEGDFAYVANYVDGTVSVLGVDPQAPGFNQVVDAIPVGRGPSDLAITPDGDRLIVANRGSGDLSVVDTDSRSETYRAVIASVATGSGSSTVAITPDGGLLYVGTDNGYLVISATRFTVVSSVATGSGTSTVSITPDGAFLVLLTTEGVVNIYDIQEGSITRNKVVASIATGAGTSTVGITPDGGLLYLIQMAGDRIFVVTLDVTGSVGVIERGASLPPATMTATVVDTLVAGEDPAGIAFDPSGSGRFVVTNAGDCTMTAFGFMSTIAGRVEASCPQPHTGLLGVEIDAFKQGTGDLVATLRTGANGYYLASVPEGNYTFTLVTPLGYTITAEEVATTLTPGDTSRVNFALQCETIVPDPRKMSFWKHQVGVALSGEGKAEIDGATLCGYLDLIDDHFNSNVLNPVVVYQPPASGDCVDKLQVAKDVLNLVGLPDNLAHARQELMALLFNVAGGKMHLLTKVSADGSTVSRAITYVDHLIDDGNPANDMTARKIAKDINDGKSIASGVIPADTPDIIYITRIREFELGQNSPNPFSGATVIQFSIPEPAQVRLAVYDVTGRLVRTLVDSRCISNVYKITWDGTDAYGARVASGFYFYKLEAGQFVRTKKMILLK